MNNYKTGWKPCQRLALAGRHIFYLTLLLVSTLLIAPKSSECQNLNSVKKCYVRNSINRGYRKVMLKLYYIIGDDKTNIDGEGYRPFIFSQDSTSVCGYVRFDTIAKRIVFIEKDYNPNDHCIGTKKIENLFCFYNCSSKICSVGYLGHFLEIISRRHRRHYTMKIVHTDPDMDTDFIAVLMFDNKLYPEKIKIYDHMSEKYIIVSAE